jgi:hypothetical protein
MDTLALIGSSMGLGFLAGIRLYATVFALGLAIRFGWYHPDAGAAGLLVLAHPAVLTASGIACLIEFVADKVPWVDSAWDSIHTFIRPIGAVLLASAAIGNFDPALKAILMLLSGSVALASTGSKASTRLAVNHSPEPFSNITLSLAEDAAVPAGMWVTLKHPEVAAAFVSIFLAVFLWFAPKIYRSVRLRWIALRLWYNGRSAPTNRPSTSPDDSAWHAANRPSALRVIDAHAAPLPTSYSQSAQRSLGVAGQPVGIRAAATSSIDGMANSVGYLAIGPDALAFVTRRWFRKRTHILPFADVQSVEWKRGLLMHKLVVSTARGDRTFHIFKDVKLKELPAAAPVGHEVVSASGG